MNENAEVIIKRIYFDYLDAEEMTLERNNTKKKFYRSVDIDYSILFKNNEVNGGLTLNTNIDDMTITGLKREILLNFKDLIEEGVSNG